ncbi:MAG: hypothetical protein DRG11_04965 [Epsilonproteobacteria bacterium]|nr:MAG: hypothetical protein DRG11_04965 [Campylobacterota bacterium]
MPTQPKPYKVRCEKCNYSTTVRPRSDCLDPKDLTKQICPTCKLIMPQVPMNLLDRFKLTFTS